MIKRKECVAMLLAGGQGSRLYLLTERLAKPAVPFGGKYRIIDFPISNCINSGIDTVGVLTQYQPLALNEYIGNGQPWDLDRVYGGVMMLPPYQGLKRADWYKGTANAIYQNMQFIEKYDPEYVLILSGDHIYRMDYAKMIKEHKRNKADCTIAVIDVPLAEASRFGIMSAREDMSIYDFEEKPKVPKSTMASMGVYVFSKEKLFSYLIADENDENSDKDFGKNVIPAMLKAGERMFAYRFEGYWKDVGTVSSLWEANMDLLGDNPQLDLNDGSWKIYSRSNAHPPHYAGESAVLKNSQITEGCEIYGTVINSVIGGGVTVARGATVKDSVLFDNITVSEGASVYYSMVDSGTTVGRDSVVGKDKDENGLLTLVGSGLNIAAGVKVPDGGLVSQTTLAEIGGEDGAK